MRVNTWICLAGALCSSAVYAGGVGLGATRMVYSSATSQAMMQVRNTHPDATFLIQSWMENEGERTNDFMITPPLYVMKPASESAVKIMFNGKALPEDRETLYWMTVKAIPQQAKSGAGNTLQFASANRIKVFYRRKDSARARERRGKTGRCLPRRKSHAQQPHAVLPHHHQREN
jgi:fimbrial chaperone protein